MRKRILSLLCVLALCLGLLPVTALAEGTAPDNLYVGDQSLPVGQNSCWTTDANTGKLTEYTTGGDEWTVKYEPTSATLTLKNATIKGVFNAENIASAGIYAASSSGPVSLNIVLVGENEVTGVYGINVSSGGAASLSISGSGSLTVSATAANGIGIFVQAQSGDANLTIDGANVNAVVTENNGRGVELSTGQAGNPNLTIEVKGGSLQASGQPNGIKFFTNANNTHANANLKVSGNAMVKTSGITTDADGSGSQGAVLTTEAGSGETGGIVWNGTGGTVYGKVELQEDLEIGEGESLTIGQDASLTVPSGKTLTNNGTVTTTEGGILTNNGTINNSGTLPGTISGNQPPKITTTSLPDGKEYTAYNETLQADNDPTQWSVTSGSLPAGLTLDTSTGVISGAPTADGTSTFTVKAENSAGSDSKAFTLKVTQTSNYFEIVTEEHLRNFANAVNEGNTTANAVLTADIALTGGNWTPIGKDDDNMYNGTFDGQGHTISGLQCSVTSGNVAGLFGAINSSGVVKNVGIADSSVVATTNQDASAGGVCGWNQGTLENCWNSSSVSATADRAYAGGVCGWNQGGTIRNCWNSGSVSASSSGSDDDSGAFAGGVCGMNYDDDDGRTAIQHCWNSGSVSANSNSSTAYAGGVCGDNTGSIENCYWLNTACSTGVGLERPSPNPGVKSKTTDEFASCEVAWLLNQGQTGTPWGQGSNGMPVLEDNHPASVTSYVPVRITIVMTDNTRKSYYSAKGSTFTAYPTGYAFVFIENGTQTWINKGTQTYDANATIYAVNMTLEKITAKAPTCTENGNSEYWYCETYDKYFSDANGVKEITYASTVIPATGDSSGGGSTATKPPSQQAINKIESAKDGATVEITLSSGSTKLDKEVFEELAGRDVTLEISMPGGVTWTVNGQDIPADADLTDLDLGVSMNTSTIPVDLINAVTGEIGTVQLTLKHDGEFGFTMTLSAPLGAKNAGLWANLYRYDEDAGKLAYQSAALVDEDGNVALSFDHASQYALVLDSKSHELPFTDVPEDAWYYDGVQFAYVRGIMKGTGDATTFSPAMPLNRAMLMTMLARLAGVDTEGGATWYEKGLAWAVAAGVSDGTAPERDITRQELMTMLYRYVGSPAVSGDLSSYPDGAGVAAWAEDAMLWSVQAGLLQGDDAGKLNPAASATRMEVAVILMRFCGNVQD